MAIIGTTGTIVSPSNIFVPVGSMSTNFLSNPLEIEGYQTGALLELMAISE